MNFKVVLALPKWPALPRHIKVYVSFELFGALYMCISVPKVKNHINFHRKLGSNKILQNKTYFGDPSFSLRPCLMFFAENRVRLVWRMHVFQNVTNNLNQFALHLAGYSYFGTVLLSRQWACCWLFKQKYNWPVV